MTFVDASKTRRKRDPGRCYRKAGFKHVGFTKAGLYVFQMLEGEMPAPERAHEKYINQPLFEHMALTSGRRQR